MDLLRDFLRTHQVVDRRESRRCIQVDSPWSPILVLNEVDREDRVIPSTPVKHVGFLRRHNHVSAVATPIVPASVAEIERPIANKQIPEAHPDWTDEGDGQLLPLIR